MSTHTRATSVSAAKSTMFSVTRTRRSARAVAATSGSAAPVSRGQMASLLVAAHQEIFGRSLPSGEGFPNAIGNAHETNIRKLVAAGITVGFPDGSYRSCLGESHLVV